MTPKSKQEKCFALLQRCSHSKKLRHLFTAYVTCNFYYCFIGYLTLIGQVVEFDFFLDLKGSMKSFFRQFGAVRQPLEERLQQMSEQAEQQLLRDEDEDDQGNLRYAIAVDSL